MAESKLMAEKIAELDRKIEQMKAQKKAILQKEKEAERKARTKRLISIGAEVERYAKCEITNLESFRKYLEKYAYAIAKTQEDSAPISD